MDDRKLEELAVSVLEKNDLGGWTQPAEGLYPHQWLWDSCFISIGLRHLDPKRAQDEIRSLLRGQWDNGMLPHIIFSEAEGYHAGPWLWNSNVSQHSNKKVQTTGITQPPLVAEAVVQIGKKMSTNDRIKWYREVFPAITSYHLWLYAERDPNNTGLVTVIHPWESGLDNTPPWMEVLHHYTPSKPLYYLDKVGLSKFIDRFRKDTFHVPPSERMSGYDLFAVYRMVKQLRRYHYENAQILKKQKLLVDDLAFNSILIRANEHLKNIAEIIKEDLPEVLVRANERGIKTLDQLWDSQTQQYYSKDHYSDNLIKVQSIATFLPLYGGTLPKERVDSLLKLLANPLKFGTEYTIPSAPVGSPYFKPHCYWQGPVWINMNWLIVDGLLRNNCHAEADALRLSTLKLVADSGMNEYFSPLDGSPAGAKDFSWTAALILDMLKT